MMDAIPDNSPARKPTNTLRSTPLKRRKSKAPTPKTHSTLSTMLQQIRSTSTSVRAAFFLLFLVSRSKGFVVLSSPTAASSSSPLQPPQHPQQQQQQTKQTAFFRQKNPRQAAQTTDQDKDNENPETLTKPKDEKVDGNTEPPPKNQIVVSSQVKLPFSSEIAFDAFSDLSRQPSWSPWLRSVEYLSPKETVWRMRRFLGLSYSWSATTTESQRPTVIAWESTNGLKNYGRVDFCRQPNNESLIKLRLTLVVPRVVTRIMGGENSRVQRFIKTRIIAKSLCLFRDVVMEEQGIVAANKDKDEEDETSMEPQQQGVDESSLVGGKAKGASRLDKRVE